MFPITLDIAHLKIIIVGDGYTTQRKVEALRAAGAGNIHIFKTPPKTEEYKDAAFVFVGGFDNEQSAEIAAQVRQYGALLNIEDKKQHCDFHMPALVRRGDLTIAVSTSGKSPRLASRIRKKIEGIFDKEWAEYTNYIGTMRQKWLNDGMKYDQLIEESDKLIATKGWLNN